MGHSAAVGDPRPVVAFATMPIRKAVFPAAGLGTRFLPATKAQPKEMLPLVDKPIIQYVIEEAVASGITSIIIVTGKGKNAIEDHFDVSKELERLLEERGKTDLLEQVRSISNLINISYVRQGESLGLGPRRADGQGPRGRRAVRGHAGRRHHRQPGALHEADGRRLRAARRPRDRGAAGAQGGDLGLRRDRRRPRAGRRPRLPHQATWWRSRAPRTPRPTSPSSDATS